MSLRFVIPPGADPDDVAWDHRPETWRELAAEAGEPVVIENIGSEWCIANNIDGFGFCTENSGPFQTNQVGG